jgi:hypothetical protein
LGGAGTGCTVAVPGGGAWPVWASAVPAPMVIMSTARRAQTRASAAAELLAGLERCLVTANPVMANLEPVLVGSTAPLIR